ncbi:MAG: hypothetical protein HY298_07425 [Verrucomicrobia bacterium]|nr:hypothetical protein [Verrucomicrobiota bacterium]
MASETPTTPEPKFEPQKLLSEVTKYTVLAAFVLYSIGFLVWQSYLSQYGVTAIGFLKAEYISAAFCYLFVLITLGGPTAVFCDRWRTWRQGKGDDKTIEILAGFWFLLVFRLIYVFFPDTSRVNPSFSVTTWVIVLMVGFLVCYVVCAIWWRNSKFTTMLRPSDFSIAVFCLVTVSALLYDKGLYNAFVFWTMLLYWVVFYMLSGNLRDAWANSTFMVRILLVSLILLVLISNVQLFGTSVFGLIPRQVGGGKPETAFIRLSPEHSDIATPLNLVNTNNVAVSNNLFGPVSILLRSEKEIIFVNYAELNRTESVTNVVTNILVNVITNVTTNEVATYETNSIHTLKTNVVKNPTKATAKQLRADLVDAIIFTP